ncbi:MAG TPA: trypsin-like peptidase domain-containing protein [Gammaproteobacteria bacterium]|nr:trypsin-like peptidase domain-containing protein [Gammaproteobacteria bacterium]
MWRSDASGDSALREYRHRPPVDVRRAGVLLGTCAVFLLLPAAPRILADELDDRWARTLERVADSVVAIRVDATRAFDTEWNASGQATGFVVDAERGLILTNRHVVQPGPVVAEAVFRNNEEVELTAVYRDPVHDFGVFRYDPAKLRYLAPRALPLRPERAVVGRQIRVIGNDAGEQLSILAGTLARLDREAPPYGRGNYNDFNTFYLQAASGTSGGSSGSPVIDIEGNVVALNAGARQDAQSSFFLPLDRVVRALDLIRAGKPVTRGTLQTIFLYKPFDELGRLGLRETTEAEVRKAFPGGTGMLVVDQVVPGGPAAGLLEVGDIVVRVGGRLVTTFIPLEEILDTSVGSEITFEIERGGEPRTVIIRVQDLHAITPDEYLEFGGAVLNELSYQQARHLNVPVRGVYIANPGYVFGTAGIPRGAVIHEIEGQPIVTLDDLERALESLADGQHFTVRYASFDQPFRLQPGIVAMDRRWFPARRCARDDATGKWPCRALTSDARPAARAPVTVSLPRYEDPRAQKLARSLVFVNFDMPYQIDGIDGTHYFGTGLVVDAVRGFVVVDRNTVPAALGDVRVTFAGSLEVPGRVVYVHPLHNLALIAYDPALIGATPVESATLDTEPLEPGDVVWAVGFKPDQTLAVQSAVVASIDPVTFPLSNTFRFREANLETITLINGPEDFDGVLVDRRGRVRSLWSSFAYQSGRNLAQTNMGVAAEMVAELLALAADGAPPLYSLEAEFFFMPLASARKLGLPDEWARRIERLDERRRRVLAVERVVAGSPAAAVLRDGDLLLAVDGKPLASFRAVERATQKPVVKLTLLRDGREFEIEVATVPLTGRETDRVLAWGGVLLQQPHRAIAAQRGIPREGVFVAYYSFGSPASRYGLTPGRRIVEVDGRPTPDLDAFLAAVASKQDRDPVRLKTVHWSGRVEVITLKLDLRYWPTYELRMTPAGWTRIDR